jgi:hypothetical protein
MRRANSIGAMPEAVAAKRADRLAVEPHGADPVAGGHSRGRVVEMGDGQSRFPVGQGFEDEEMDVALGHGEGRVSPGGRCVKPLGKRRLRVVVLAPHFEVISHIPYEEPSVEHRVVVEYISGPSLVVYDCHDQEEARARLTNAKMDRRAWHIYYKVRDAPEGPEKILTSLYRTYMADWSVLCG